MEKFLKKLMAYDYKERYGVVNKEIFNTEEFKELMG